MRVLIAGGGISGLATGWQMVKRAKALGKALDLTVVEATPRLGGTIFTEVRDGFRFEWGPNGFLDSKPDTVALAHELGLGERLLASDDAARKRFVMKDGELEALPAGPGDFLKSRLLTVGGRWRVIREQWVKRGGNPDETVAEFATRRLGPQALERLIDPFVSGIFAGDPAQLSVAAAFPRLVELESEYGSLIKASRQLARTRPKSEVGAAGPGGRLTSFPGGMSELIAGLGLALGHGMEVEHGSGIVSRIQVSSAVDALHRGPAGWEVAGTDGLIGEFDQVVLAIPAWAASRILGRLDPELGEPLAEIPYAAATVVGLGYRLEQIAHNLNGFGFLAPSVEDRPILGCLWSSSVFPGHRAPEGHALIRTIVGGARAPERALLEDEALVSLVEAELAHSLGADGTPAFVSIARHASAIPQYVVGHAARREALEEAMARWPGLAVTGNALYGVGINDCTREASRLADELVGELPETPSVD